MVGVVEFGRGSVILLLTSVSWWCRGRWLRLRLARRLDGARLVMVKYANRIFVLSLVRGRQPLYEP